MGGMKWSGMSDKSTYQNTPMASFPALPLTHLSKVSESHSPRITGPGSDQAACFPHGSQGPAGWRHCPLAPPSSPTLNWLPTTLAFLLPKGQAGPFHLKDLCLLLALAPGCPKEGLSHQLGLMQLLPPQRSFPLPQVHSGLFYFLHCPCQYHIWISYLNIIFVSLFISVFFPSWQVPGGQRP